MKLYYAKLLKGLKDIYLYDALENYVVKVPNKFFEILNNKDYWDLNKNYYENYLKENNIRDVTKPITTHFSNITEIDIENLESRIINGIDKITLSITNECNMECIYCIYHDKFSNPKLLKKNMTWDVAKKAMDMLLENSLNHDNIRLGFYGGECLMRFNFIKECVEYFEKCDNGVLKSYGLTTNGILLAKKEIRDYLTKYRFFVLVSFDGPQNIHDRYRKIKGGKGTYQIVLNNLKKWYEESPEYFLDYVSLNTVCAPPISDTILNYYFKEFPIKTSYSSLVMTDYFNKNIELVKNSYEKKVLDRIEEDDIFECNEEQLSFYKRFINVSYGITNNSGKRVIDKFVVGSPCLPYRRLFVSVNGKYYPCEKVDEVDINCIGDVNCGIIRERVLKLMSYYQEISSKKCSGCWAHRICYSCYANVEESCEEKKEMLQDEFIYYLENIYNNRRLLRLVEESEG